MINIDVIGRAIGNFWQLLLELARGFSFKDVIDVAIVTILIYGLIKLLRETRAGQLVKGLLLFIIIYLVSMPNILDLAMLNSILTYFFQSAFIAILIVFQPEIRKALEQMGRSNVGKSIVNVVGSKDKEASVLGIRRAVNSVVDAVSSLQKMKMGALIVFERSTKLGDILETGTMIDAQPSGQLIANVFFNKAPLHDGAMVIRKGRIVGAGCILPLTRNDTLSDSLGTRHRAALGVSEESDAVVVVVSEETGQVSVAVNGTLRRNFTKETLREALDASLLKDEDNQSNSGSKRSLFQKKRGSKQ